ncbi:immunoglobulin-like and fibronectin type III domain-containing protein 1 [Salarias fasciatus]|uniref:immunoglobulin-like and fibronectin type III domain-containing protein 1 n=1 Tax=Salarias fasciatus TaxID=181472 RepID=UPI001176DDF2|nr:immunoglobulin-like and fibronectin type III domain-containing protein 1 [Salarias fasciatus]
MWKRTKNSGPSTIRQSFSLVHRYIQHFNEVSGNKSATIRRRSKIPGVMITQFVTNIPEGKSTPDFQCKPTPINTQEGHLAVFKAVVKGDPKPEVSWKRTLGSLSNKDKYKTKYEESTGEHILEIHNVSGADADTYKCYAVNEYGKAVCSATLNVTDASTNPADFRKLLRKSKVDKADGENDERFWEAMLNADGRDYEHICSEFGVTDLHLVVKKLEEKKRERAQNKSKDDVIPYDDDATLKYNLQKSGRKQDFGSEGLINNMAGLRQGNGMAVSFKNRGLHQVDAEEDDLLLELKLSNVDFVIKIQEIKAREREDALFECVLTHPLPKITWLGKGIELEDGEKYKITASDHKLIHRLLIRDCVQLDTGIYSAVAGGTSCSAWLVVEGNNSHNLASGGKKIAHKTTLAVGALADIEKVAREQQMKNREEMEKILAAVKAKHAGGQVKGEMALTTGGGESEITEAAGRGKTARAVKDKPDALCQPVGTEGRRREEKGKGDGTGVKSDTAGSVETLREHGPKNRNRKKHNRSDLDAITESDDEDEDDDYEDEDDEDNDEPQISTRSGHEGTDLNKNKNFTNSSKHQKKPKKVHWKDASDSNDQESDNEGNASEENQDAPGQLKKKSRSKSGKELKKSTKGKSKDPDDQNGNDAEDAKKSSSRKKKSKRKGPLVEDAVIDPGVHFISGLSDVNAIISESAELTCRLSSEDCDGVWFRDGKQIVPDDSFSVSKDGSVHTLVILRCTEEHSGKYRFEADGRKTEAMVNVKDPPRINLEDLTAFTEPVTVKTGHHAIFKANFVGFKPIKIQWYREGEELLDDASTKIEKSCGHTRLLLSRCHRKDTGEIKLKLKNEHGFTEAVSQLNVLDKPTSPQGPAEVTESSASCIEFRWRPPKDDGGSPVVSYAVERRQVGRNTWKKLGETPGAASYRDTDVEHGRRYCYRVRAATAEGVSEVMETDDMQAGTLAFPGPPAPPKVISAFDDCINLAWTTPSNTGGSRILGYILEKRKKGSNLWTVVNALDEVIKEKKYAVKDVVAGMEYEFRVTAINLSGPGESSNPSEFVFARDPKKPPGKVFGLKVVETSYTHMVLTWTKPEDKPGIQDEARGYFVEIRKADCLEWSRCNSTPMILTSFSAKGLKSMDMYWVRVIAVNDGGESAPEELPNYVLAMPLPVRPKFTNKRMKSFMVVRAGNSVRITVNFEASPRPHITWLKDNAPVTKRVTVSNSDGSSQMLIPSSERSDSGIYSVLVKNLVGQETFSTEVRVTDDPKPPGPVELEENVPDTVTVIWEPSPDEKRDDRLHYLVSKLDSTKRTWTTVADRLFNNKFTICNIVHGREYHFRVYAKNDMGVSAPSESSTWGVQKKKEKFVVSLPIRKDCDLQCAPTFIVPLKLHTAPKGYECYMSCAVKGNPAPRITWYRNHISINTNTNYYISNTCGVCSMLILRVRPKDMGEYTITAENSLGRAECTTVLSVRELPKNEAGIHVPSTARDVNKHHHSDTHTPAVAQPSDRQESPGPRPPQGRGDRPEERNG